MNDTNSSPATIGIDLGSRNVKICLMHGNGISSRKIVESSAFYREYGHRTDEGFSINTEALGYGSRTRIVATGYGRMSAALIGALCISELKAHALGAQLQTGMDTFTLLDVGGQDYKIIRIENGVMIDIATNDKCAASTGRYLENMAKVLGITLDEIGVYHENPVPLSSTCAIFGESELIGLVAQGVSTSRLAAGVNRAIAERVVPLLERMGPGRIIMSGGVALNRGVVALLEAATGRTVQVVQDPLFNGAIGCCVYGKRRGESRG